MVRIFVLEGKFPAAIALVRTVIGGCAAELHYDPGMVREVNGLSAAYAADGAKGFHRQALKIDHYLARPRYDLAR